MPGYQQFLYRICELLQAYVKDGPEPAENTQLLADLGLSSLQVMELIEQIEDEYDISIPLNVLTEVRTVGDLSRQLEKLTGTQA